MRPPLPALLLAGVLLAPALARAATLPPLLLPHGIGVNIHFQRGHETDLDRIAAAGFRVVRMDLGWAGIERERGRYDWSAVDELTANLSKRGLRPLYILDYSNPLYEESVVTRDPVSGREHRDTASPRRPESVAAFAAWAAAAAARYTSHGVIWEIWNEPNIFFWKPRPDVAQYNALALATCEAIRAADPRALIVGPATSEIPLAFLEAFFASGILRHLDGVSVHPYRNYAKPPETVASEYAALRALIRRQAPPGKEDLPILSSEWGYASHTRGVSPETQAAFAARQQLVNLWQGIPVSVWYDWKNDGPDPAEREHNFGVVTADLTPKPAYEAIRTLTGELAGHRLARRIEAGGTNDYVLLFIRDGGAPRLAAWTAGEPHTVELAVRAGPRAVLRAVNSRGGAVGLDRSRSGANTPLRLTAAGAEGQTVTLDRDRLAFTVGPEPLYLTLDGVRLKD